MAAAGGRGAYVDRTLEPARLIPVEDKEVLHKMKGYAAALGLSLLVAAAGGARATTAVIDFADNKNTKDASLIASADSKVTPVNQAGRNAVQTGGKDGNQFLSLSLKKGLFDNSKAIWARVEYLDRGTDSWQLEYDTDDDPLTVASPVRKKADTGAWTQQTFKLIGASLKGRQPGGSDLRINDLADGAEIISRVVVTDEDPDKFQFPKVDPAKPIVIDGKKSPGEWDGAFQVVLDRADQDVVGGWQSKEDFSGTYSFKWDTNGLYILGEVNDATPGLNDADFPRYYSGDGVEQFLGLDQSNPTRTEFNVDTDFQVVTSLGIPAKGGKAPAWEVVHGGKADPEDKGPVPAKNLALVLTDKGYMFELMIPWTLLKADAKVKEGQEIGWYMFANNSRELPSGQQIAMTPFKRPNPSTNPSRWATAVLSTSLKVEAPPTAGE